MPKKSVKTPRRRTHQKISTILLVLPLLVLGLLTLFFFGSQRDCANSRTCIRDLSGNYDPQSNQGVFLGQEVYTPSNSIAYEDARVLGETDGSQKRIEIDLANQKLYAFEGNNLVYDFPISSGKWGRTPTGDFRIWIKLRYTRMSGGSRALGTYYNLPNVPYTMYFYNDEVPKSRGYGIHGAYWHNNFGHPMSHGCINMKIEDVEKLYYWATPYSASNTTYATDEDPGTPIKIYGVAPDS